MIKLLVNIKCAQADLQDLLRDAMSFCDCHYESPHFKLWQEKVRSFISRTYDDAESKKKLADFNGITYFSAAWADILTSIGKIDPASSGLGDAVAMLTAWNEDLSKRHGEHRMDWIKRIIIAILGLLVAGGVAYLSYVHVSNRSVVNNGSMNNVNLGDNAVQQNVK